MEKIIRQKLVDAFAPVKLEIFDDSHLHAGHTDAPADGSSHFRVVIVSEHFAGMSRLERQRAVNAALAEELKSQIHALTVQIRAPNEV